MPFQKRVDFISTCDKYNQIAIRQGYLKSSDIDELMAALETKGIKVTVISVPKTKLEWGTSFVFKVEAIYSQSELQVDYNNHQREYTFLYSKKSGSLCEE